MVFGVLTWRSFVCLVINLSEELIFFVFVKKPSETWTQNVTFLMQYIFFRNAYYSDEVISRAVFESLKKCMKYIRYF